ncbi:hypothetical protein TCON_0838 [Astathelohania contejeani]|uniref:Uncharacterized protein n=1 Tax=Astathelohania contejeani TaxID=164912 RepID=A0ABQ7I0I7_9MICR|nr:hypothetical protein TCON_0838 [Thelohania contejeani]
MQLKSQPDLFVTLNDGYLSLEPATPDSLSKQYIIIRKRKLFFYWENQYCTLAVSSQDILVRATESYGNRRVGYYKSRREITFFDWDKQDGGKKPQEKKRPGSQHLSVNKSKENPRPVDAIKPAKEDYFKRREERRYFGNRSANQSSNKSKNEKNDEDEPAKAPIITESHTRIIDNHVKLEEKKVDESNEIDTPKKLHRPLEEEHHILSDSSFEQMDSGYKYRDVTVKEIDKEYFQLIVNNTFCVSYFEKKFIFGPCVNNDNQYFRLVKAETVLKEIKKDKKKFMGNTKRETHKDITIVPHIEQPPKIEQFPKIEQSTKIGSIPKDQKIELHTKSDSSDIFNSNDDFLSRLRRTFSNEDF